MNHTLVVSRLQEPTVQVRGGRRNFRHRAHWATGTRNITSLPYQYQVAYLALRRAPITVLVVLLVETGRA